ncbi:MAG: hypothetical protein WCO55_05605 [Candidatus Falkowbacteria bacterium]
MNKEVEKLLAAGKHDLAFAYARFKGKKALSDLMMDERFIMNAALAHLLSASEISDLIISYCQKRDFVTAGAWASCLDEPLRSQRLVWIHRLCLRAEDQGAAWEIIKQQVFKFIKDDWLYV